jgi:transposase
VEKTKDPRVIWVFRTPSEKWHKECIHGVTKGLWVKLMVWGCIWGRNKGPLIPIFEKRVNRWAYIGILEDGLLDAYQEVHDTIGDPVFQQYNAKIHTAADTMQWFEEHNIQIMEWSPNSPDHNPIEHCWKRLKEKLHERYPDISKTRGGPEKVPSHPEAILNGKHQMRCKCLDRIANQWPTIHRLHQGWPSVRPD